MLKLACDFKKVTWHNIIHYPNLLRGSVILKEEPQTVFFPGSSNSHSCHNFLSLNT